MNTQSLDARRLLNSPKVMVAYRMPLGLERALREVSRAHHTTKTDVICRGILNYIGVPPATPTNCVVVWLHPQTFERLKGSARFRGRTIQDHGARLLTYAVHTQ